MEKEITIEDKRVCTKEFRVSFPALFKAKAFKDQEPKFSITMLFDKKGDGISTILGAAKMAAIEKWGQKAPAVIKKIEGTRNWPIHDGDREKPDLKGYPGHFFVTAKAKADNPPGIVDRTRQPILSESEVYAGSYGRATLIAYAYDHPVGGKGIGFSLQNYQKLRDGEKFTGKKTAENDFDAVEDLADNEASYVSDDDDPDGDDDDGLGF